MAKGVTLLAGYHDITTGISAGIMSYIRRGVAWRLDVLTAEVSSSYADWVATRTDAAIAVMRTAAMARIFLQHGKPTVNVISDLSGDGIHSVLIDDAKVGAMAADYLLKSGYRQLGFYGVSSPWSIRRFEGFRKRLRQYDVNLLTNALNEECTQWPGWGESQAKSGIDAYLDRITSPTAVLAHNDQMASLIIDCASERGLAVPRDIAVLGVDNNESVCESGTITISSVDPDLERIGYEAARTLDALMNGRRPPLVRQLAPRAVVQRCSTDPFAHRDELVVAAMRYIGEHALEPGASVDALCAKINVSRRLIERRFTAVVGCTPGDEIRRVRLNHARNLLTSTTLSIANIALRCGFGRPSSFSEAFHRQIGMTPRAYRERHGQ